MLLVNLWFDITRAEENTGHVNLFIHMEMDSSKHDILYGMKTLCIFSFLFFYHLMEIKSFVSEEGGGGVFKVNLRVERILSKLFPYINWFTQIYHPPKISLGISLKCSVQFVPWFSVINLQIPMNSSNSKNSSKGPLIIPLVSTTMTLLKKPFGRKRGGYVR